MAKACPYSTEADLVRDFVATLNHRHSGVSEWTIYHETAGWDLLLVHADGFQVGLEAKLSLNAKVIAQALDGQHRYYSPAGPDYRGVIVPSGCAQLHMSAICDAIGIGIVKVSPPQLGVYWHIDLPQERYSGHGSWPNWCPSQRCALPDYVPDVCGGHASPVQLTDWKIKAIKLAIILDRRGFVTRADMKALSISPSRWTDSWHGFLDRSEQGYVRNKRTPDLKGQHPTNWAQIEADIAIWGKDIAIDPAPVSDLFVEA